MLSFDKIMGYSLFYGLFSLLEFWLNYLCPIAFTHISLSKNIKLLNEQKIRILFNKFKCLLNWRKLIVMGQIDSCDTLNQSVLAYSWKFKQNWI